MTSTQKLYISSRITLTLQWLIPCTEGTDDYRCYDGKYWYSISGSDEMWSTSSQGLDNVTKMSIILMAEFDIWTPLSLWNAIYHYCDNLLCGHEPLPKCPINLLHNYSLLCMRTFICNFCSWLWMVTHCRPTGGSYKISPPQNLLYLIIVPDLAMVRGICLTCHNIQIKPIDITGHLKFTVMRGLTRSHYSWTVAMHSK